MYHEALLNLPESHPAKEWLREQVSDHASVVDRFQLGFVETPVVDEHRSAKGRLAIPNITQNGEGAEIVVGLKFRLLDHGGSDDSRPKFIYPKGQQLRLYNLRDLLQAGDVIAVCEGESDTWAAWSAGYYAVGVPGTDTFGKDEKAHRLRVFQGFSRVILCRDNDDAGGILVDAMEPVESLEVRTFEPHKDVREFVQKEGAEAFRKRMAPRHEKIEED